MAQQWTVDFGDFKVEDVEASNEAAARERALERLMDRVSDAQVTPHYSVYEVKQHCTGCRINVRARSRAEAKHAVQQYTQERIDELRDVAPPGQARSFLKDLHTGVEVRGESDTGPYELDDDGKWNEGTL